MHLVGIVGRAAGHVQRTRDRAVLLQFLAVAAVHQQAPILQEVPVDLWRHTQQEPLTLASRRPAASLSSSGSCLNFFLQQNQAVRPSVRPFSETGSRSSFQNKRTGGPGSG